MSDVSDSSGGRQDGARTAGEGTPVAVDVSRDRLARAGIALFLSGPVIWSLHFMAVYLVVEAGCTGGGPGLRAFDPPVPFVVTLAATAVAALASLAAAAANYRLYRTARAGVAGAQGQDRWPDEDARGRGAFLGFAGALMALLGLVTVLFVGLPALVLPAC